MTLKYLKLGLPGTFMKYLASVFSLTFVPQKFNLKQRRFFHRIPLNCRVGGK